MTIDREALLREREIRAERLAAGVAQAGIDSRTGDIIVVWPIDPRTGAFEITRQPSGAGRKVIALCYDPVEAVAEGERECGVALPTT